MAGSMRTEKPLKYIKPPVFTRKTEVSGGGEYKHSNMERRVEDQDRLCPIHNKPHPVRKCCGFHSNTLVERKAYLKEKHLVTTRKTMTPICTLPRASIMETSPLLGKIKGRSNRRMRLQR